MEEDKLQPLLDFEAQWEQELKTLKRKQATTKMVEPPGQETKETETREDKDDEDRAMPMNPRELVEMDMQPQQQQQQGDGQEASVKEVVVTLTDEQKEWLATLPRRQCLQHIMHCTTPHQIVFFVSALDNVHKRVVAVLCGWLMLVFVNEMRKQTLWTTWRRR